MQSKYYQSMGLRSVLLVESGIKKKKSLNITLNGHILGHISKPPCWPKDNMNGKWCINTSYLQRQQPKKIQKRRKRKGKKGSKQHKCRY